MYIDILRQAYRDARMMEVIELLWVVLGVAACVSAAALGIPGLVTGSLLCIARVVVFMMA